MATFWATTTFGKKLVRAGFLVRVRAGRREKLGRPLPASSFHDFADSFDDCARLVEVNPVATVGDDDVFAQRG